MIVAHLLTPQGSSRGHIIDVSTKNQTEKVLAKEEKKNYGLQNKPKSRTKRHDQDVKKKTAGKKKEKKKRTRKESGQQSMHYAYQGGRHRRATAKEKINNPS